MIGNFTLCRVIPTAIRLFWIVFKHFFFAVDLDNHSYEVYDVKEVFIWLVTDIPRNDIDAGRVVYSYFGDEQEPRRGKAS